MFIEKHYINFIEKKGYIPKMFNAYNEAEIKDIAPTQSAECGNAGSSAAVLILEEDMKDNEDIVIIGSMQEHAAVSKNGIVPTLTSAMGMGGGQIPMIQMLEVPQMVKVRKYEVDIEGLKKLLAEHKKFSNREIADKLGLPLTMVEHWFRKDKYFSIPEPEVWLKLKELLEIADNSFDESILTFEEREGVYDKANRYYYDSGIAPTLTASSGEEKIILNEESIMEEDKEYERVPLKFLKRNQKNIEGDYAFCVDSSNTGGIKEITPSNFKIRKLTPRECWRLMSFPDEKFDKAASVNSNTQLYKQAGNSIVVSVLEKIFINLLKVNKENEFNEEFISEHNKNAKHQQDLIQDSNGVCRTIPAGTHGSTPHLLKTVVDEPDPKTGIVVRKLTPRECWRLMSFEDIYFDRASQVNSNTQLYKQAGNSIVVDVLEKIFRNLFIKDNK